MHLSRPSWRNWLPAALMCGALLLPLSAQAGGSEVQAGAHLSVYTEGVQAYRAGEYGKATRLFRQVLSEDAGNINAHYYLGLSLDYLRESGQAAGEYRYVVNHGSEQKIIDFAKKRLAELQPVMAINPPVPPATPVAAGSTPASIAMMAAGNQMAATVYRGSATRIAVPLKNSKNALMVDATLTNNRAESGGTFIIDTGATYTSISHEMAEELGLDLENCETVRITTANGRIDVPKVTIGTLNVNGLEAHNVEATVIPVRHGASFSGLIGLSFIKQFVLTIDPQGGQLIFQKN